MNAKRSKQVPNQTQGPLQIDRARSHDSISVLKVVMAVPSVEFELIYRFISRPLEHWMTRTLDDWKLNLLS